MSLLEKARDFISRRRNAYCRTFDERSIYAQQVLRDLERFCRAHESTFHPDPRVAATLDGRREVWLRIQSQLNLSDEQLWALHAPAPASPISQRSEDDE